VGALAMVSASVATVGCGATPGTPAGGTGGSGTSSAAGPGPGTAGPGTAGSGTAGSAVAPPEPEPARDGGCPYLETAFVADTNGQRVSRVRLSADGPHPACFFYRADGAEQLRVQVLTGVDPLVAKAVVDRAAPVASSDPATLPGGWQGGKQPTEAGAVFAVARAGAAVVVTTNQQQTIKASRIAERVIATLGL